MRSEKGKGTGEREELKNVGMDVERGPCFMGNEKGEMIEGKEEERDPAVMNEKQIKHSPTLDPDFGAFVPKEEGDLPFSVIALCQANLNSAFYISSHTQGTLRCRGGFA